ncbi:hypothetical protein SARC_16484, partial [Sphaeroforma arctica JP610]
YPRIKCSASYLRRWIVPGVICTLASGMDRRELQLISPVETKTLESLAGTTSELCSSSGRGG